jgi:hypothetical protein
VSLGHGSAAWKAKAATLSDGSTQHGNIDIAIAVGREELSLGGKEQKKMI